MSNPLAGPPEQKVASEILNRVLSQVNIAHLETREEAFLKDLANIVSDQALEQVRTEINRAVAINVAGGGIAKVTTIENLVLEDIQALDGRPGFRGLAQWTATLNAAHWGHSHQRTRQYRAQVELTNGDGPWKIDGITIVDVKEDS